MTFGDQIMSMQRVSSSCLRHCESSVGSQCDLLLFLTWIHSSIRIKQIHPKCKQDMRSWDQKNHKSWTAGLNLTQGARAYCDLNISSFPVKIHLLDSSRWCDAFSFKLVRENEENEQDWWTFWLIFRITFSLLFFHYFSPYYPLVA